MAWRLYPLVGADWGRLNDCSQHLSLIPCRGSSSTPLGLREPMPTFRHLGHLRAINWPPGLEQGREKVVPSGAKVKGVEDVLLCQDLKHSPGAQKPADSTVGLRQRNRITVTTEERRQTSYQTCLGKEQKGGPATLTCVHRRLAGMLFQLGVLGSPKARPRCAASREAQGRKT